MNDRYIEAAHRIQSAVATEIQLVGDSNAGASSKHLRTGLNMVMADVSTILNILVAKGIITKDELIDSITKGTEVEAERLRSIVITKCGLPPETRFE